MIFPPIKMPFIIHLSNKLVDVIIPVIISPFAFLQMAYEIIRRAAVELGEPSLCKAPEVLDPVDMTFASGELTSLIKHPVMGVSVQHQAVVCLPSAGVNGRFLQYQALYYGHERLFRAVRHYCRENLLSSFQKPENRGFAGRAPSSLASDPPCSEIRFIQFVFSNLSFRLFYAFCKDHFSDKVEVSVYRIPIDFRNVCRLGC